MAKKIPGYRHLSRTKHKELLINLPRKDPKAAFIEFAFYIWEEAHPNVIPSAEQLAFMLVLLALSPLDEVTLADLDKTKDVLMDAIKSLQEQ